MERLHDVLDRRTKAPAVKAAKQHDRDRTATHLELKKDDVQPC